MGFVSLPLTVGGGQGLGFLPLPMYRGRGLLHPLHAPPGTLQTLHHVDFFDTNTDCAIHFNTRCCQLTLSRYVLCSHFRTTRRSDLPSPDRSSHALIAAVWRQIAAGTLISAVRLHASPSCPPPARRAGAITADTLRFRPHSPSLCVISDNLNERDVCVCVCVCVYASSIYIYI